MRAGCELGSHLAMQPQTDLHSPSDFHNKILYISCTIQCGLFDVYVLPALQPRVRGSRPHTTREAPGGRDALEVQEVTPPLRAPSLPPATSP